MRKFSSLVGAAILGSAITYFAVKAIDSPEAQTVKVEHIDAMPALNANYTVNEAGETVSLNFRAAAQKAMPAVVHIRSTQTGTRSRQPSLPDPFRDFFGPYFREDNRARTGTGSGVIINKDGYIVTNNHVIANADDLEVTLHDNRSFKANVIGTDPSTDIAVVKIEEKDLAYLSFVNSDQAQVGDWVLAVGNPFNLNSTVTAGIVSAKGRSINILADSLAIESFIQTDAAVNPGNSGGALVDLAGNLIGVNTAIASPTGAYSGYSFAVPSNIVSKVVEDLIAYGMVQRGVLGIKIKSVNTALAREHDLEVSQGVYVANFSASSAAEEAGLKSGDVIVAIDGKKVNSSAELIGIVGSKRPGDEVNLTVNRYGKEIKFKVVLKNLNGTTGVVKKEREAIAEVLGIELEDVDEKMLKRLGLDGAVRVTKIKSGKIGNHTDMREGFIITKVDNQTVSKKEDVINILSNKKGGILIEGVYEDSPGNYYYGLGL